MQTLKLDAYRTESGQVLILPPQDMKAYQEHCAATVTDLKPVGALERSYAHIIAGLTWRILGAAAEENNSHAMDLAKSGPTRDEQVNNALLQARPSDHTALARFSLAIQRLEQTLNSTLKQFHALQDRRQSQQAAEMPDAVAVLEMKKAQDQPWEPKQTGFISTVPEIERHIQRNRTIKQARTFAAAAGAPLAPDQIPRAA